MSRKKQNSRQYTGLVYSTDKGRICPACGHPADACRCSGKQAPPPGAGVVRISRQTKGRKGSGVCQITGLLLDKDELKKLAKFLKKKCGSGGAIKNGVIEIQGDHRQQLLAELTRLGHTAKLAGG